MITGLDSYESDIIIGNYSQYISDYNLCGYPKSTLKAEKECLMYSKSLVPIGNARDAMLGEAPWVVSIQSLRFATTWEKINTWRSEMYVLFNEVIIKPIKSLQTRRHVFGFGDST